MTVTDTSAAAIVRFRNELLSKTIDWCTEKSSFFRVHLGPAAAHVRVVDDLPLLPVLHREQIIDNFDDLQCEEGLPACIQNTSGTAGTFMHMYRGSAEIAFIWDFFSRQIEPRTGMRPLYLALTSAYHGAPTPIPSAACILSAGVYDRTQATQARNILQNRYSLSGVEPRVSAIIGAEVLIRALTAFLIGDGVNLRAIGVHTLVLTGGHLSKARKEVLGELWGAAIQDRYSMSEIFGGAMECGIGGPWIFDTHVIPEVVHPRTFEPITEGVGLLLLTGLYPFMQRMPLIRYDTGDLVEIAASQRNGAPDLMVRFVGRQRRSIFDDRGERMVPLLLANPLYDSIEALPDIAMTPRYADLQAGPGLEFAGKLHYEVDHVASEGSRPEQIILRLGLRYAPWMFPGRVAGIATQLRQSLYSRFPALKDRVARGELELIIDPCSVDRVKPYNAK